MAKTRPLSGAGPSQRQLRVAEVIRRALSDILTRDEVGDPELGGVSITVSEVRVSPDLRQAVAYVLPLGGVNTEGVLAALARNRVEIRRLVTRQIDLKYSPELSFSPDRSFDQMDRTRDLLGAPAVRRDLDGT
jgi:ribosome-binding factor A